MKKLSFFLKIGFFYKIASLVLFMLIVAIGIATYVSIREQTTTIGKELIEKKQNGFRAPGFQYKKCVLVSELAFCRKADAGDSKLRGHKIP